MLCDTSIIEGGRGRSRFWRKRKLGSWKGEEDHKFTKEGEWILRTCSGRTDSLGWNAVDWIGTRWSRGGESEHTCCAIVARPLLMFCWSIDTSQNVYGNH